MSYGMLRRVPLPAEYKWRGTEELFAASMQAMLRSMHEEGALYGGTFGKVMDEAGSAWMASRSRWVEESPAPLQASAELLSLSFKTLDMVTTVRSSGDAVEAVTWRCPFVEHARTHGAAREACEHLCGAHRSLFTGFASALPVEVTYSAPSKMGWGDAQCVKRFAVVTEARARVRRRANAQ
jgi:predicted ArsR family transcriptional regulator